MHQYRIQYQKFLNVMVLADTVAHSALGFSEFSDWVFQHGWLTEDGKGRIAPGCIQQIIVIA